MRNFINLVNDKIETHVGTYLKKYYKKSLHK